MAILLMDVPLPLDLNDGTASCETVHELPPPYYLRINHLFS